MTYYSDSEEDEDDHGKKLRLLSLGPCKCVSLFISLGIVRC